MTKLIGRIKEIGTLKSALQSNKPELIALYGRRRIGKTFLIRKTYRNNLTFEFTGIHKAS